MGASTKGHLTRSALTPKQALFVKEYVKSDGNGTQSALKAYNTTDHNTANQIAMDTLRKPTVQNVIAEASAKLNITPERVLSRLNTVLDQDSRTVPAAMVINQMNGWTAPQKQDITHRLGVDEENAMINYIDAS